MKIFCYGSNMRSKRLMAQDRCPDEKFLCVAELLLYSFSFNKKSKIGLGSGKGNVTFTGNSYDSVWGVVFEVPTNEENLLDEAEGLGKGGYVKEKVRVRTSKEAIETIVYLAKSTVFLDDSELPFDWYKDHCVRGATEFNLPVEYVDKLEAMHSKVDINTIRAEKERSIYLI